MPDEPELVLFDTMSVLQNFGDRYRYLATRYARRRPHLLALRRPRQAKPSPSPRPPELHSRPNCEQRVY